TMPPHAAFGPVDLAITTASGPAIGFGSYTYVAPPTVASLSPQKGKTAGGDVVTLVGSNFLAGETSVRVGSADAASVTFISPTTLTFITPATAAGSADITVTTSAGSATLSAAFVFFAPPVITSFSPVQGASGTVVTLTGANFDPEVNGNQVSFGGVAAVISSAS